MSIDRDVLGDWLGGLFIVVIFVILAVFMTGCADSPASVASVGGTVSEGYFLDAKSGKCLRLHVVSMFDRALVDLTLTDASECKQR